MWLSCKCQVAGGCGQRVPCGLDQLSTASVTVSHYLHDIPQTVGFHQNLARIGSLHAASACLMGIISKCCTPQHLRMPCCSCYLLGAMLYMLWQVRHVCLTCILHQTDSCATAALYAGHMASQGHLAFQFVRQLAQHSERRPCNAPASNRAWEEQQDNVPCAQWCLNLWSCPRTAAIQNWTSQATQIKEKTFGMTACFLVSD